MKGYIPWLSEDDECLIITIEACKLLPYSKSDLVNWKYAIYTTPKPFIVTKITGINGDTNDRVDHFTVGKKTHTSTHRIYKTLLAVTALFKSEGWMKCEEGLIKEFNTAGRLVEKKYKRWNKTVKSIHYMDDQIIIRDYRKNTTTCLNKEDNSKRKYNFIFGLAIKQAIYRYHKCELINKTTRYGNRMITSKISYKNNKRHGIVFFRNNTRIIYQNGAGFFPN